MSSAGTVSVVVPVYRSEDCVAPLVEAVVAAFRESQRSAEVILVNDCSPDRSWERIVAAAEGCPGVIGINLRRNFGQDNAIMAGLRAATGDVVVIMDDDLQHDPRDMEPLIRQVLQGYDVCYANFRTKKQAWWKNLGSWFNGKVAEWLIAKPPDVYLSPYKAVARGVVREVVKYDGPYPYVDGLILRVTSRIAQVEAGHHERYAGRSNYNLVRCVGVWLRLATSFSLAPLRLATYMGFAVATFGLLLAAAFIVRRVLGIETPAGWASLVVVVLVLGGAQLACLGMIGEYLGRVYLNLNRKPQYAIREVCGGVAGTATGLPTDAAIDGQASREA